MYERQGLYGSAPHLDMVGVAPASVWPSDTGACTGDDPGMGDDELADFLAAYAKVCAEVGIDPLPQGLRCSNG